MGHILIAEDDDAMRNFLARSLERAGHEVVAVGSGTEALPHIASEQFDLLLTDIVMPGMDGLALAKRAAILAPGMKVVFITGFAAVALNHGDEPVTSEARVLSKPFHLKDVVAAIDELTAA